MGRADAGRCPVQRHARRRGKTAGATSFNTRARRDRAARHGQPPVQVPVRTQPKFHQKSRCETWNFNALRRCKKPAPFLMSCRSYPCSRPPPATAPMSTPMQTMPAVTPAKTLTAEEQEKAREAVRKAMEELDAKQASTPVVTAPPPAKPVVEPAKTMTKPPVVTAPVTVKTTPPPMKTAPPVAKTTPPPAQSRTTSAALKRSPLPLLRLAQPPCPRSWSPRPPLVQRRRGWRICWSNTRPAASPRWSIRNGGPKSAPNRTSSDPVPPGGHG